MHRSLLLLCLAGGCSGAPKPSPSNPPAATAATDAACPATHGLVSDENPKIAYRLTGACFGSVGAHDGERLAVVVLLDEQADPARAKADAERAVPGATVLVLDDRAIGGGVQLRLSVAASDEVAALAAIAGVAWIEPRSEMDEDDGGPATAP